MSPAEQSMLAETLLVLLNAFGADKLHERVELLSKCSSLQELALDKVIAGASSAGACCSCY